ncbi:hypothetical protein CNMCM6457_005976 [Aspergillus fumigatiaffinis]|nr:hypothetical protein CNMCM6457_005976 [Aspergillus fumigatiaffinis]
MSDQSASTLDEVLTTLRCFVDVVSSRPMIDLQSIPEFNTLIHRLCEKAPKAAQAIALGIQNFNPQEQTTPETSTSHPTEHKRKPNDDPSYRPPRSSKRTALSRDVLSESSSAQIDELIPQAVTGSAGEGNSSSVGDTTDTNGHLPSQTGEIYTGEIPASPESILSEPPPTSNRSVSKPVPITPVEAVEIIYKFSKYQDGPPRQVHARILQSLQGDSPEAVAARCDQWSDGSMWLHMLENGSSNSKKATIFNMLEYMGACEWYDSQIELELQQGTLRTAKNKPVDRRGAAIHTLNRMQDSQMGPARQSKWISGIGRVALEGQEASQNQSTDASLTHQARVSQRTRILMQLTRGRKLRTKLVRELGLGVLFCPKIWTYTKMSEDQLEGLINEFKRDDNLIKLLRTLSPQLELLVKHGSPDLRGFYEDLEKAELGLDCDKLRELTLLFALEGDALSDGELDVAVNRLIERVSTELFARATLGDNDEVTVNGSMELPCDCFQRFRGDELLNNYAILGAMQISDRPAFVRHFPSVPLDDVTLRSGTIMRNPLSGLTRKIEGCRRDAEQNFGTLVSLVYFCPLNHNRHFTLLEINEREKAIRHYDSMADPAVIKGEKTTRISTLVEKEFGGLNFSYSEAPTPQQSDGWSCGVRVVWNYRRLSNGFPIGTWTTKLCPKRMKLEIVEGLIACVESNTMRRGRP